MSDEKKTMFGFAAPQNLSVKPSQSAEVPVAGVTTPQPPNYSEGAPTVQDGGPFQGAAPITPAMHGQQPGYAQPQATPGQSAQHYGAPAQGQAGYAQPQVAPGQGAQQYGAPPQGQAPGGYGAPAQGQAAGGYGAPPQGQAPGGYGAPPQGQAPGGHAQQGHVPHVKPVKTALYVTMFFASFVGFGMLGVGLTDPKLTELVPFAVLPVLVSVLFQWILLYKAWAAIQDGHARTSPGAAVGLLFIPLFSIYWIFIAYGSWGKNFNAFSRRHGVGFEVSEGLFTLHCFMMFFAGPIALITGLMICLAMCRGINAVANRQYGGLPVARLA